jgi:hypothetical protein
MLLFAATALDKASKIPASFWLKFAAVIVALIILVLLLRKLAEVNKVVLAVVGIVIVGVLGFSWIYERNEPAFLTPVVDAIAPFFPSKGAYQTTQQGDPKQPGLKKSAPTSTKPAGSR